MAVGKTPEKPQQSDDAASEAGGPVQTGSQADAQGSLDDRLRKLESHLAAKGVGVESKKDEQAEKNASSMAQAMKLSSEFIAGIVVGAVLGWFFDRVLGTNPWGLIIFLFLGFGAGTLNVLRTAGYVAESGNNVGEKQQKEK
ncbi:AtpZ/AtpI family protein [Pseudochrobactrum algeriensis]|uniref:ATP synthase protein I n=1 Tax=Pseudochrobactrum saccharolyticum TaxID=354352 RepID=A0A7W8AGB7_9HYPH|nr:AtpZ/AtpI family protein [Pseudochrobactrum saccharolyticum]MBX8812079.1 ATP synthase subunit [Ochrobactrum sp. MR34]QVQ37377.1 AtpZ/AtpI family protein [Pseudochrobactrum algeriensis]QYM72494.1 AtpZ/AtpI family protein [Pseudochrobactrum sp. Wa41.01b-1]KAB0540276.1 ATP synthase subunit [Pseudochrobactrum saccharolyticum]MBB5089793.1 ATP synthase protein I [Pseudochrobactrum saccharolyticum]